MTSKMKITKSELQKIIKEEMEEVAEGLLTETSVSRLQTMLYRIEDDFVPYLQNTRSGKEFEIARATMQLRKLLKEGIQELSGDNYEDY
tara:strand:+ start:521 stop:787 length:267 start_codon:yes stop_codon:yes gene_type:complete